MSRLIKMLSKGKEKEEELGKSSGESNSHIIHHELRIPKLNLNLIDGNSLNWKFPPSTKQKSLICSRENMSLKQLKKKST